MSTPIIPAIPSGQSWDAPLNEALDVLGRAGEPVPLPLHTGDESDLQTTFAAADYDQCQIWVDHTTLGRVLAWSDGSSWQFVPQPAAAQADSTAVSVGDLVTDFNNLLAAMRAAGLLAT
jgi:hypothetical protein